MRDRRNITQVAKLRINHMSRWPSMKALVKECRRLSPSAWDAASLLLGHPCWSFHRRWGTTGSLDERPYIKGSQSEWPGGDLGHSVLPVHYPDKYNNPGTLYYGYLMPLIYGLSYPPKEYSTKNLHGFLEEYSISQECSDENTKPWFYGLLIFILHRNSTLHHISPPWIFVYAGHPHVDGW